MRNGLLVFTMFFICLASDAQQNDSLLVSYISSDDPAKIKEMLLTKSDLVWLKDQISPDDGKETVMEKEKDEKSLEIVYNRYVTETTNTLNGIIKSVCPNGEKVILEETILYPLEHFDPDFSFLSVLQTFPLRISELRLKTDNAGFLISFCEIRIGDQWKFFDFAKITNCLTQQQESEFYHKLLKKFSTKESVVFPVRITNSQNKLQADIILPEAEFFGLKELEGTRFPGFSYDNLLKTYPHNSVTVNDSLFKFYLDITYGYDYARELFTGKDSLVAVRDSSYIISQMNAYVTDHYTRDKMNKNEFILSMMRVGVAIYNIPPFGEKFKPEDFEIVIQRSR